MKTFDQILQQIQKRRAARPVYRQLELPLGGAKLGKEQAGLLYEFRKLREALARG